MHPTLPIVGTLILVAAALQQWPARTAVRESSQPRPRILDCDQGLTGAQILVDDMALPHESRPNGVPIWYDWAERPRLGMGNDPPPTWSAAIASGMVYAAIEGNPATNTRVHVRDIELWVLSRATQQWTRLQFNPSVDGAGYREDFQGNVSIALDLRPEPEGGLSARLVPGHNFHFWTPGGRAIINAADIAGIFGMYRARLVVDNPGLPDDRDRARFVASAGGDYWLDLSAGWQTFQTNGDFAIGRFKRVCTDWRTYTGHTLTPEQIATNPPPPMR